MQTKNVGIISSIIIAIAVIGVITIGISPSEDTVDKYAVDLDTVNVLLQSTDADVAVIDIRTAEQYQFGHLDGAAHDILDSTTLEKRVKTIQSRLPDVASTYNVILIDDDGIQAKQAAQTMTDMGILAFYLDGGMNNVNESLIDHSQIVIDSKELMQRITANKELYLLDVREPSELLDSKIDGSINIPLAEIFQPNGMDEIPTDKPVIVICGSGNRATIATYALAQEGIDFQVLEGGMKAWNSQVQSGM